MFWIRVHELPLMAQNEYVGGLVGNLQGQTMEVDLEKGQVELGKFM